MRPKTARGWYNKFVRGYPYDEKTAHILDHTFKPNPRLISTLVDRKKQLRATASKPTRRLSDMRRR